MTNTYLLFFNLNLSYLTANNPNKKIFFKLINFIKEAIFYAFKQYPKANPYNLIPRYFLKGAISNFFKTKEYA